MSKQHKIKWHSVLIVSGILLVFLAALAFCLSMVNTINQRMNESATSNLLNTTVVMAETLEGYIQKDYDALNIIGTVYKNDGMPSPAHLQAFSQTMKMEWLGFVDAQGNGIDNRNNSYHLQDYPSSANWDLTQYGYSDAYIGRFSGRPQITLWAPIYDGDTYIGTVLSSVILTQYYSANVFTFYNGEGRTYIFSSKNGNWILKSLGNDGMATLQPDIYSLLRASGNSDADILAFQQTVEAGKTGVANLNFNGEPSYLCFLPMKSSPNWYVTTVIARDTLLRESSDIQRMIIWVLAILCFTLAAVAIAFVIWRVQKTKSVEAHYREALFANISANLDSAFLIYEKSSRKIAFVSDNFKRLLGLNPHWLVESASHLFDWCKIPVDDLQRTAFLEGTLDTPTVREVYMENELGENTRAIRLELIPADLGQELAVLTDITKDKDIQHSLIVAMEQAEAASRAKNDFLSSMSHDLRTPINGIVGMTAIAAAHLEDKNRIQDCLTKISESSAHLLSLINEVLDMSQIESGRIELAHERFNLAKLLQDVLSINYPGIQQKNHKVKVRIHLMEHEVVIGDPARLTRVATNLISNAIKYTPAGGEIKLTLREKEPMIQNYGCYELVVEDNGIGMSAQFQEKLFQPFEREEDVRIDRIQGTGLGMSIAKSIVTQMMGSIHVESEKGKGSIFRVTINLRLDKQDEKQTEQLAGLPVLVVDDDADLCQTVVEILHNISMIGEWASNGAQAVKMVIDRHEKSADYLAVLLDWKMPHMDGVETARRIRAAVGNDVPIIILTAYDWSEIETQARDAGVDAFLSKPIYKAKLLQKMNEIVSGTPDSFSVLAPQQTQDIPQGRRILLAEDNELNQEIAVELLRMMGVEADCTNDGVEVVARFAAMPPNTYDLILMDIQMPRANGYEATQAIRSMKREDGKLIPIVAMTADAFKKDEQAAFAAGMDEHLSKPISIERLADVLRRFLVQPMDIREETKKNEAE